ncbi:MAG: hypothetical protein V3U13_01980 [Gemmatimonadota bacterium]
MADPGFLRGLEDDGLYTPSVKRHSLRKIEVHNYYVSLFSTAMSNQWPQRAYLGLYSGAGRARVAETDEIVETTVMSAFRVRDPFGALQQRSSWPEVFGRPRDRDSIPSWVLGCPRPPTGSASTDAYLADHAVTRNEFFL